MFISQNKIRIVCTKENEEEVLKLISKSGFLIQNRYDRKIIILELKLPKNYNSDDLKKLLDLQDIFIY